MERVDRRGVLAALGAPAALRATIARHMDRAGTSYYLLFGATVLLVGLGLAEVFSASTVNNLTTGQPLYGTFVRQLIAALIGLPLMWLASRLPARVFRRLAKPLLLATIVLLLLVVVIGHKNNGNQNWLIFGPITVQPSELAKLALLLWGADLLVRRQENPVENWNQLLMPLLPGAALIVGLIMLGGDMGTSVIVGAIVLGLLWVSGVPARMFGATLLGAAVLAAIAVAMRPSRAARFTSFLDPASDPRGHGLQALHSFSTLQSGGFFGVGFGASKARWGNWLPADQTDFIFSVIGEELGLVGALTVMALFLAIGYAGLRTALYTSDAFVRLAAGGVTVWLMAQALINFGAVLGILPIAGVPLPFVSYGGSSLLPAMFAVGMLLSFARDRDAMVLVAPRGQVGRRGAGMLPAGRQSTHERGAGARGTGGTRSSNGPADAPAGAPRQQERAASVPRRGADGT
jgi:cell division protein FtsW